MCSSSAWTGRTRSQTARAINACLAAYLDAASPDPCFTAIDAAIMPIVDNPWGMDAYCTAE